MTAAGLPDWVAKDDDGYEAIAQKMASNRKALLALKKGLRKRLQTNPAWDVLAHTRAIEHALLKAA
jgi:predicted O-linked N-acetylglucosamine transferase (SPINDLY family)